MDRNLPDAVEAEGLLKPEDIEAVVTELLSTESGSFTIEGSLLDHKIDEYQTVLSFEAAGDDIKYDFGVNWPADFPEEQISEEHDRIRDAFIRAGVAEHLNVDEVMKELRSQDDVILGIDDDILRDGVLTSILLEKIYEEDFPNWILIGVPKLVVSGIESAAKDEFTEAGHPLVGWPTYQGRIGQRALQEIMDLRRERPDRPGLSVMTIGEMRERGQEYEENDWRLDARIRDQFREYLDDIGFRKGTYFLSQNRVNVMMTDTEGGEALHLQKPEYEEVDTGTISSAGFGSLIQELCLQFGSVRLRSQEPGEILLELSVYWPGKRVSDWEERRLNVVSGPH